MTNFDLSNYIRWLKPGMRIADEQQQSPVEPHSGLLPQSANYIVGEDSKPSIFSPTNPLAANFLGSTVEQDHLEWELTVGSSINKSFTLLLQQHLASSFDLWRSGSRLRRMQTCPGMTLTVRT